MNELHIQGLSLDSRRIKAGDLFIALSGYAQDGRRYIPDAIQNGAVAVLIESNDENKYKNNQYETKNAVPIIPFSNLRNSVSAIAGRFFSDPSRKLNLIGITGTNGKTSCSHFIAQILDSLNLACGVMGTLGNGFLNDLQMVQQSTNTTTDPISAQEILASLKEKGAGFVAMEVTSHALTQGRVEGLHFKTAIFTNLTRDHLDYHQDMQSYFDAKKRLFTELKPKNTVINMDDAYGQTLLEAILHLEENALPEKDPVTFIEESNKNTNTITASNTRKIIGFSTDKKCIEDWMEKDKVQQKNKPNTDTNGADQSQRNNKNKIEWVIASNLIFTEAGSSAYIETPWGNGEFVCPLLGRFNLSNALSALIAVCLEGISFERGLEAIKHLKPVAGRMIAVGHNRHHPKVVIDYAHTPDALQQVLQALRLHCRGKLHCVFGCGGDRDRGKRAEMARVAETLSDKVIVTQDNPRTENKEHIIQDIMQGFQHPERVMIEPDRKKAIDLSVRTAAPQDIILIAGKGHEDYQIVGREKFPFSDQQEAIQALERRIK